MLKQSLYVFRSLQLRGYAAQTKHSTFSQKKKIYGDLFPDKLLTKKHKSPDAFYMTQKNVAEMVDKYLDPFFKESACRTILEMNPGNAYFTQKLLGREDQFEKIILMEGNEFFMNNLQELHSLYPERVKVKHADFINIWKSVHQDRMDNGSRVLGLLREVPQKPINGDPNMIIYGNVGSYYFFKHMINSIVFHNSFLSLGRSEMYFVVPPAIYIQLTCSKDIGLIFYRSSSILFQILFEYSFIARLPRDEFLPTNTAYNPAKPSKLDKIISIDPEHLYLVRIVPRKNIFDFVSVEDLPALWYFIKQNCISRRSRIIPSLEKWIPGCGPRLIVNNQLKLTPKPIFKNENKTNLPQYSTQCLHLSPNDVYPNINIYTQFGDLRPGQFLNLFTQFRKWPEYKESSFLASFESSMIKMPSSAEDSVEGIQEEDDDVLPELQSEVLLKNIQNDEGKTKSKEKKSLKSKKENSSP